MNSHEDNINKEDNLIKISNISLQNPFHGKYLSARSCFDHSQTKEIIYQNKIFNIKKKFTVPSTEVESTHSRKLSIINQQKIRSKPSDIFAKHIDNVIKNRRLLRRGVWEMPFEIDTVAEVKKPRYKTEVLQSPKQLTNVKQKQALYRSAQQKRKDFRSVRNLDDEKMRQLPSLRNSHEVAVPIRLSTRYGSKPISCKTTQTDEQTQIRNALNRKIAVEIINYNLLGKWASSSLKI